MFHPLGISLVRDEWKNRHMPGAFDSFRELTLMRRADSADSSWKNLSALRDEMPQKFPILKIYIRDFFRAEFTDSLAPNAKPSLSCHILSLSLGRF
jgi:hypothetical protein